MFSGGLLPALRAHEETAAVAASKRIWESSGLARRDMKSLTEVAASLLLALVMLRLSGSLVDIIYEWKLRAGKS